MSSERLAIERATWAVAVKTRLQDEFIYREHLNDYSTMLVVTHKDSPDWNVKVTITSSHGARNRVEIGDTVFSYSFSSAMRDKLVVFLNDSRHRHTQITTDAKRTETEAKLWMDRQKEELAGIKTLGTVGVYIIRGGPNEGQYCLTFFPGHPLEHLTLEQVKTFHVFIQSLGSTKRDNVYVEQAALEES